MTSMDDLPIESAEKLPTEPAMPPRVFPAPPIRVDRDQLTKALEPVVSALVDLNRTMQQFAFGVEALGRVMQQVQQENARRSRSRPFGR